MPLEYPDFPPVKMATQVGKVKGVQWFHKSRCAVKSGKEVLYGVWKGTANKNVSL
jgi:hypothetical protein